MTAKEAKTRYLLKEWADRITECTRSGMTAKDWCEQNGLKPRTYGYWLKKVREYAAQFLPAKPVTSEAPNGWALVRTEPEIAPPAVYKEERRPSEGGSVSVEIGRFRVTAAADADEAALAKVLRTLAAIC